MRSLIFNGRRKFYAKTYYYIFQFQGKGRTQLVVHLSHNMVLKSAHAEILSRLEI